METRVKIKIDKKNENIKTYNFEKVKDFKFGENPQQKASLFKYKKELDYEMVNNTKLSYNNILDCTTALEIASEFFDVAGCVIVKHTNPCAVALAQDIEGAFDKALDSDPISIFNGVAVFTRGVELSLAKKINAVSIEVVIAPSFSEEALEEFKKKKGIKLIKLNTPLKDVLNFQDEEIKLTPFGALIQEKNKLCLNVDSFKVVSKKKPEQEELEDMIFAFKVVKHVKSSGIVIAQNLRTIGIGSGQSNNVISTEIAINRVCDSPKGSVIASDGCFSSIHSIQIASQNRISGIIQPAGSIKDKEIIAYADKMGISMVATGIRHFKH